MKRLIRYIIMLFRSDEQKEKMVIAELRQILVLFDQDYATATDQEIKDGMQNVADTISKFGLTPDEAANAIKALGSSSK